MRPGGLILAADGPTLAGLPAEIATAKLTGLAGTHVTLTLAAGRTTRTLRLLRTHVPDPSVTVQTLSLHGAKFLDVRVTRFAADTSGQVLRALAHASTTGARGAILDLRANAGGLVSEALATASALLLRGATIVSLRARTGTPETYVAAGQQNLQRLPLIELTDHNTISAGEILTGALKDNHRALIVGQHTYGKGVYQELVPLQDGGGLELTIGQYYTPYGQTSAAAAPAKAPASPPTSKHPPTRSQPRSTSSPSPDRTSASRTARRRQSSLGRSRAARLFARPLNHSTMPNGRRRFRPDCLTVHFEMRHRSEPRSHLVLEVDEAIER